MIYEQEVYLAVRGHAADNAVTLWEIIAYVFYKTRSIISWEQLSEALFNLSAQGSIAEVAPLLFYDPMDALTRRSFSGLTSDQYEEALKAYHRSVAATSEKTPVDFARSDVLQLLFVVRWHITNGQNPTRDEEQLAKSFAKRITAELLAHSLAENTGMAIEPGLIDLEVYGYPPNATTAYNCVAAINRTCIWPSGSCIVRNWNDGSTTSPTK